MGAERAVAMMAAKMNSTARKTLMSALLQKYGLDKLTTDEKEDLADRLWEEAAQEREAEPITPEVKAMLDERLARMVIVHSPTD